jgi:hypothetical protein
MGITESKKMIIIFRDREEKTFVGKSWHALNLVTRLQQPDSCMPIHMVVRTKERFQQFGVRLEVQLISLIAGRYEVY